MTPPLMLTEPLSEREFLARFGDGRYELVRGQLRETAMPGMDHGYVCFRVAFLLGVFVEANRLGWILTNDTFLVLQRDPDHLRGMDVCFLSFDRFPSGVRPRGPLEVMPELVVEVRSPSDRTVELQQKVSDYLQAGVSVVLVLDPERETVAIHRLSEAVVLLAADGVLSLPDILPGFEVLVADFFR